MTYASGYTEADLFTTVGGVVDLDPLLSDADTEGSVLQAMRSGSGLVIATPSGARIRADSGAALFDPQESGFYEVRSDAEPGGPAVVMATNVDVSESQMSAVNVEEFIGAIARPTEEGEVVTQAAALPVEDQERRQGLWWYLLLAVLMLFGAETVVSNRLSRAARR